MQRWWRHWTRGLRHANLRFALGGIVLILAGAVSCVASNADSSPATPIDDPTPVTRR